MFQTVTLANAFNEWNSSTAIDDDKTEESNKDYDLQTVSRWQLSKDQRPNAA